MDKGKVVESVRAVTVPAIEDLGYELVDLQFLFEDGRWRLRFFIDKPGGVGINDCEAVSREVETLIEVEDILSVPYAVEVSSPGLDRPLFKPADYVRFEGSLAKIRTTEPLDGQKVFLGRIESVGEDGFSITTADNKTYYIEYGQVERARLEVEF